MENNTADTGKTPADLPSEATFAWQRYVAMIASKDAHFGFLELLEEKYQHGGTRTLAEIAHLEGLLETHNSCVQAFTNTQKLLATNNPQAHKLFINVLRDDTAKIGHD